MALSNAVGVRMCDGRTSRPANSTAYRPAASASCRRRESGAGVVPLPGGAIPSASARHAIVEAVPIVMQWPGLRMMHPCSSAQSAPVIRPARSSVW